MAGICSTLALGPWLPGSLGLGQFPGPTSHPGPGKGEGSPIEMGLKAWELFPTLLRARHS